MVVVVILPRWLLLRQAGEGALAAGGEGRPGDAHGTRMICSTWYAVSCALNSPADEAASVKKPRW